MHSVSIWHWIIVIGVIVGTTIPVATILNRAGRSRWWCIFYFIPPLNLIMLWVFAYTRWPAVDPPT
jgi:hypothetical protein